MDGCNPRATVFCMWICQGGDRKCSLVCYLLAVYVSGAYIHTNLYYPYRADYNFPLCQQKHFFFFFNSHRSVHDSFYLMFFLSVSQFFFFWHNFRCTTLSEMYLILKAVFVVLVAELFFVTPQTFSCQAPLSMGCPRQEYWSGLPFPSPRDLFDPVIEPTSFTSYALQVGSLPTEPPGKLVV